MFLFFYILILLYNFLFNYNFDNIKEFVLYSYTYKVDYYAAFYFDFYSISNLFINMKYVNCSILSLYPTRLVNSSIQKLLFDFLYFSSN